MSFGWGGRWIFRGNKGYFGFYTTKGKWKWRITSRSDQCRDRTVDEEGVQLVLHHVVRLQCWFAPFFFCYSSTHLAFVNGVDSSLHQSSFFLSTVTFHFNESSWNRLVLRTSWSDRVCWTSSGYQIFQWARPNEASQKLMVRYNCRLV